MDHHMANMLCLSTVHVKPETMERLENGKFEWLATYKKAFGNDVYGAFVVCDIDLSEDSEEIKDIPCDLLTVLIYADAFHADWIMFDRDEDEIGELPAYRSEWDRAVFGR